MPSITGNCRLVGETPTKCIDFRIPDALEIQLNTATVLMFRFFVRGTYDGSFDFIG